MNRKVEDSWLSLDATENQANECLKIRDLRVDYGSRIALQEINLRIPQGEIFGLLGPNGAGKTTLFRVLATLHRPTHGEVRVMGKDLLKQTFQIRSRIAYMSDLAPVSSDLKVEEYLKFFAECYGIFGKERDRRVRECLESVDLLGRSRDFCHRLSLGMRQRLALAKSILHRPDLLILDEPASGLDPMARIDLRNALRAQAASGATIILSSHVLAEIQDLCTSIGLLRHGKLLDAGPIRKILARHGKHAPRYRVRCPRRQEELYRWLSVQPMITEIHRHEHDPELFEIEWLPIDASSSSNNAEEERHLREVAFFESLAAAKLGVTEFSLIQTTIEDVIVKLSQDVISSKVEEAR